MKWLVPLVAAFTLIGAGAASAAQTGESQGSQAKKPFKSSETTDPKTTDPKTTEQGSECEHSKKMKQSKSTKERGAKQGTSKGTSEQKTQTES
ncbi:MAG: hypothetical protein ACREYE_09515 [Gammaproteobacteria bacterium]